MTEAEKPVLGCPQPCERNPGCRRCRWLGRYYARQRWINAYARVAGMGETVFRYRHPLEQQRYRRLGPCVDCPVGRICDTPCPEYVQWWNEKMAAIRTQLTKKEA